jgi:uncharacterized protein (TIGR02270 family)
VTAPKLSYIPDLLELHFEELQFLWARRRDALRSPAHVPRSFAALEERIEAHVQGLLAVPHATPELVTPALTEGDRNAAFAAAYALFRLGDPALVARVVDAVPNATPAARRGLTEALCHAHAPAAHAPLAALAGSGEPAHAAAALEVFAFRGATNADVAKPTLDTLLAHDDADLRFAGWRVATYLAVPVDAKHYSAALGDDPPGVRLAALEAGAWARVPGVVAFGRQCVDQPTPETLGALRLLAVLGSADDARRVAALVQVRELGPARFACAAASGSPALVEPLIAEMAAEDPESAVAAGAAFTKLTGEDVTSTRTATVGGGDGEDAPPEDTVALPDPARARDAWQRLAPALARAERIYAGVDVARALDAQAAARLDMESRWDLSLRARYHGAWQGTAAQLEVFPQRL